jgi:hypothetical protein
LLEKQYISDVITQDTISKWKPKDRILIHSQTGTGKSQWVKDRLKDYAIKINKKILLLSNRNILRKQNIFELGDDQEIIELKNYQSIESSIIYGKELDNLFSPYYYIVYDECHYLLNDSSFNRNTDLLMNKLKYPNDNKIFIFISATPEAILSYNPVFEYEYTLPTDYSYIKNIYFYSKEETVENIIRSVPSNEQIIYFGNAMEAYDLHNLFRETSSFICSDNNVGFSKKSSKSVVNKIEKESRFDNRILFSTKVLDNGINLISSNLHHVFIDMMNPIDVIQCLGRRRNLGNNDYINLYIKNFHKGEILFQIRRMENILNYVDELKELGKDNFAKKYFRNNIDNIIHNDYTINYAKLYFINYYLAVLRKQYRDKDNLGYKKTILDLLQIKNIDNIKIAENYYEAIKIEDILEKYSRRKLYKNGEIELFRDEFFENLFSPQKTRDIRNRGIISMNSILREDKLPYHIFSLRENSGTSRNKRYWYIYKLQYEDNENAVHHIIENQKA